MTLFLVPTLQAQIVYTDIADGIPAGIDFNNDGTYEFEISENFIPGDYITYNGATNNIHALGTLWDVPSCEPAGYSVNSSSNWQGAGDCSIDNWGGTNVSITVNEDEYLAVKFQLSSTTYYGWIRISLNNTGDITYMDYAYNSTAHAAINTGDQGSPVVLVNSISIMGGNEITTANGTLQLSASILPVNASDDTYTWSVTNGTGTATISPTGLLTATTDGTVTVTATANDASGITGTLDVTISNQTIGLEENNNKELISFYPNPVKDFIRFESKSISKAQIYSMNGNLVLESENITNNTLSLQELKQGVYLLVLSDSKGIQNQSKLIKE